MVLSRSRRLDRSPRHKVGDARESEIVSGGRWSPHPSRIHDATAKANNSRSESRKRELRRWTLGFGRRSVNSRACQTR